MINDSLIERIHVCWMYVMRFIDNNQVKTAFADFLLVTDAITHGLWTSEYHELLSVFGVQASNIDAAMAALALVRICILLDERTIKR